MQLERVSFHDLTQGIVSVFAILFAKNRYQFLRLNIGMVSIFDFHNFDTYVKRYRF